MQRRLAAIVAIDVVGYSALMRQDERATLDRLIAFRTTVFDPAIAAHSGRVVKLMGDGALVEFASVVDAVACAIAIQTQQTQGDDPDLHLRIGVNLGDVIVEDGDLYGDGVNIAARLESIADPGGICISGLVHQSIGNRVDAQFVDLGLKELKNIDQPVPVFRWAPDAPALPQKATLDDKPGIVVLAFDNMSADPEQEYFSDGIAEDIITALSHFREFHVIARNTSFTFKGQAIRVDQVCRDLGVRYLLEGSVRKAGNRVRVTGQLIDGETGAHLWANRYDRALDDIFAVQDEITQAIVGSVAPEALDAETRRARNKRPDSLSVWDKISQARWHLGKFNRDDNLRARDLLSEALHQEPELANIHTGLAHCDLMAMLHAWHPNASEAIGRANASAERAVALDANNAYAHAILGMASMFGRRYDAAEQQLNRSITLNPNLATGYGTFAAVHGVSGNIDLAKSNYERALALSPRDPLLSFWRGGFGIGAYVAEDYALCLANARAGLTDAPGYASLMRQEAASLAMLDQTSEARAAVDRLLADMPELTIAKVRGMVPVRHEADWERWLDGLRRAGLPEGEP